MLSQTLNVLCNISSKKEKSRVSWTGVLEGCKPGKRKQTLTFHQSRLETSLFNLSLANSRCQETLCNMSTAAAPATVVPSRMGVVTRALTWHELFVNAEHVFTEPVVEFGVLAASLFTSADSPDLLLAKVEALAHLSPVVIAMISDEEPDRITLLKNPRRFRP